MSNLVKIVECPRDAWQGLAGHLPIEVKTEYLRRLIDAGFRHIDAVSFVSPKAVPQMADSEEVLRYLMPPEDVEIIGIVVNEKGAERAVRSGAVQTIGFPYSISTEFLQRNQNQTPDEALDALEAAGTLAYKAGLGVVAYLSMAFGNSYGEPWSIDEVVNACELLADSGVQQISLADTVGLATPSQVEDTLAAVIPLFDGIEVGVHLHARPRDAAARISAAYAAGCRRFDSAIGGLGGCPFAQDALVGNIATETLLATLRECGAVLPDLGSLDGLVRASAAIGSHFGAAVS
ncbi:hydroxymethylglutaryl-CoA lyase [Acidicapsa dinghuensis]|uniref:Hydroxymethylglutaryl-CoA lyase n=1 Tax=Acidicapsa dinghuensis TaxID=2218256 RepID=A0ABW1ECD0_9BACT|nr:hydroxymethylglutaryl-CoA lyase [Acidicapsa dinghuensis]